MASVKLVCDAGAWLDRPTSTVQLTPLGWLKTRALLSKSTVSGEKVHGGPSSLWFDLQCPTLVGSVDGKIYKVAITVTALTVSPYELVPKVSEIVSSALGTSPRALPGEMMVWDGDDGNVVLQPIPNSVPSQVNIFLTSNIVRPHVRQ
jgi:hypothetical protein